MPVLNSVKEKILECYEKGMGVSDSYTKHYNDLKTEYGDRYCDIMCNRGLCPDKGYFYRFVITIYICNYFHIPE